MKFDNLDLLRIALYAAFGATCSAVGVGLQRPMAFFALFGLFMANDILGLIRQSK